MIMKWNVKHYKLHMKHKKRQNVKSTPQESQKTELYFFIKISVKLYNKSSVLSSTHLSQNFFPQHLQMIFNTIYKLRKVKNKEQFHLRS